MSQLIDQYIAAAERGFNQGVRSAISKTITSTIQRVRFQAFLEPEESVIGVFDAETRPPVIVRMIPVVSDVLVRAKKYALVVTPGRLAVVSMTNPFNKLKSPSPRAMHLSIPWNQVSAIEPRKHLLTSSVVVRTRSGDAHRFTGMLKNDATRFAVAARDAAAPAEAEN